ncbi:hypothetical protein LCGC14_1582340 [marine sediment metagenome]|uniref:Uncharacterized protein n=1 Tax=marine sediment metagenome TaxID=412755 RepID=A0A0F9LGN0_9ZZZZ
MYDVEYNWSNDAKVQEAKDRVNLLIDNKIPFDVSYVQRVKKNAIVVTTKDEFKI